VILLLNEEAVVVEMLLALRRQVAKQLELPVDWVDVKLALDKTFLKKATYHPEVTVNAPPRSLEQPGGEGLRFYTLTPDQVRSELEALVTLIRNEINLRLRGLDS